MRPCLRFFPSSGRAPSSSPSLTVRRAKEGRREIGESEKALLSPQHFLFPWHLFDIFEIEETRIDVIDRFD